MYDLATRPTIFVLQVSPPREYWAVPEPPTRTPRTRAPAPSSRCWWQSGLQYPSSSVSAECNELWPTLIDLQDMTWRHLRLLGSKPLVMWRQNLYQEAVMVVPGDVCDVAALIVYSTVIWLPPLRQYCPPSITELLRKEMTLFLMSGDLPTWRHDYYYL